MHGDVSYHETPSPLPSLPDSPDLFQLREEHLCPELLRAVEGVKYIADVTRREEESNKVNILDLEYSPIFKRGTNQNFIL